MFEFGIFQQCSLIFMVSVFYIIQAPFSKVEESFSIQAIHDFVFLARPTTLVHSIGQLFNNSNQSLNDAPVWDHETYPGVVHRTFITPFVVALFTKVLQILGLFETKFSLQIVARVVLHLWFLLAYSRFIRSVSRIHGKQISCWITLLFVTQFHFLFYSSRTLPNTFALIFVLFALSDWIEERWSRFIPTIAFCVVVVRFETIILFGCILLVELWNRRISLFSILASGIPAGICSLAATVAFDSVVWGKWIWPEGDGILFNIISNKSHEYGTSPFLWYFYSALPRLGLFSLGFLILAPRMSKYVFVSTAFVLLYSLLPHKEVRFIIYVTPLMNLCVAQSISDLWNRFRAKVKVDDDGETKKGAPLLDTAVKCFVVLTLIANLAATALLFRISSQNYPGGAAIVAVNNAIRVDLTKSHEIGVYVSNLAAQSGFTRFLELDNIHYNKEPKFVKKNFKEYSVIYAVLELGDEKRYFDECQSKILCSLRIDFTRHSCNWIQNITAFDRFDIRALRIHYRTFLNIYRCSALDS